MHSPLVSVIVAVYNMREHIRQCIESVLAQSLRDLELILVDDLSTDGTAEILQEYARQDKRIHLVWQKQNGGAQLARNAGFEVSSGKYITVLDHDDLLDVKALEHAVDTFRSHEHLQCVCLKEVRLLPNNKIIEHSHRNSFGLISGEEAYKRSIHWKGITGRMIVSRELQQRFPFDNCERVYGEDNTAQLQFLASTHVCSCDGIYYHRILGTSLSHKVSLNNIRGNLRFISMKKQLQSLGYGSEIIRLNETAFWESIVGAYHYYYWHRERFSIEERKEALNLIKYMRSHIDTALLPVSIRIKPGFIPAPTWTLFRLQEEMYLFLKRVIIGKQKCLE